MKDKTYLVGEEMTVADLVMINKVSGYMKGLSKEERWSKNNFSRWYDLIQNSTDQEILSGLGVEKIKLAQPTQKSASTANPKASGEPKEKKKKEEKPKKEKAAKEAAVTVITPAMIDIRVGIIVSAEKHPDADSLYVEQIDVGEEQPRTVVSGLVKYMTLDELIGRKVLVVCNLKPASMRGVKSFAMVLCTSKDDKVEFVEPHLTSVPGDRAYFEEFSGIAPEPLLNPKKKIWETIQPGLFTNGSGEAGWYDADKKFHKLCVGSDGFVCKSKSITDGIMK
ncbi:tRNA-aminoacylation cofactor arc1 [Zancudomyces culisetae]|uniref:tRNA-aminoacylation cofactor arc1 n=1 Tax=Zancudomyces culisetae TaxID=1213189 RepID=A0A1R1PEV4_ZANCU|nr:tRNA-aminoacylation cofactor arc1 [Zancudomyces culisetae]|eukprot:OMH79494.1 tRNA-aminoacylation cofactor arc1 [Zancudomyces culisetae]